jgi:hypothetical protein
LFLFALQIGPPHPLLRESANPAAMRDNEGYEIRYNGVPRTFRDKRDTAFHAARYAKSKARGEIIEIVDRSTGAKLVMLEDGRTG